MMRFRNLVAAIVSGISALAIAAPVARAQVAAGIPEPDNRNVIVQLFNWRFEDIENVLPTLRDLGYSHVHVSPAQKSNEHVWQWWGRYQPVDYSVIEGPLGSEAEYQQMNTVADNHGMQIIADVVLNHTVDVTEQPSPPFIVLTGNTVSSETFPQFSPADFNTRCNVSSPATEQSCWLSNNLADLRTDTGHVRNVAKDYLNQLASLGVDGFRFDAAVHIEPEFYSDVLSVVPDKFAVGEIIKNQPSHFQAWLDQPGMDFKDFPLLRTMREAFAFGGDLRALVDPQAADAALPGPRAVTLVRNHDVDRGQANDRGIADAGGRNTFGVGWNEGAQMLDRIDVNLAYAYIFAREDGFPYVFTDMNTLPVGQQDDRYDDPFIVAAARFHNLCLAGQGGVARREDIWRIQTPNTIAWQRGTDRFVVINKAGERFEITNLATSLQPGEYKEVRTGWRLDVQPDGSIQHWSVPERSAMMFVRVGA
jgi:alpha-amylase